CARGEDIVMRGIFDFW
nr:immunoglobulin heavy chain junction region [Macaca mulatta]MOW98214.1 immunoglobulin heavy chain junction region [Macaca mulatta]MOW98524.1 immunoglobulin heavy chain junction region [Macaca mulatta]MOW98716.1 immunoglobulin heavy chain junction region [Macaca mulatta]MOX00048.1 immunoglobulin heavy chain junction region [Macaca mulatta]